jgi:hypothetical protein
LISFCWTQQEDSWSSSWPWLTSIGKHFFFHATYANWNVHVHLFHTLLILFLFNMQVIWVGSCQAHPCAWFLHNLKHWKNSIIAVKGCCILSPIQKNVKI